MRLAVFQQGRVQSAARGSQAAVGPYVRVTDRTRSLPNEVLCETAPVSEAVTLCADFVRGSGLSGLVLLAQKQIISSQSWGASAMHDKGVDWQCEHNGAVFLRGECANDVSGSYWHAAIWALTATISAERAGDEVSRAPKNSVNRTGEAGLAI